jgi:hypothetical protein
MRLERLEGARTERTDHTMIRTMTLYVLTTRNIPKNQRTPNSLKSPESIP